MAQKAAPQAAQQKKPNILVIWGDDIGISNLSCYSHGLMGYKTPNIDRIASEGMMFTDSYGEQSCTAGRSSFITGQSVYRTGLSKVGIPGGAGRHVGKARHHRRAAQGTGLCHRPVRQEPSGRPEPDAADKPRLRRVLRQPLPPQCRGRAGDGELSEREGFSQFPQAVRSARGNPFLGDGQGRQDGDAALGQDRQAEDQGHRPAEQEAHGDLRRRVRRRGEGLYQAPEQGGQAVVRVAQHDAHALLHAHQEVEPRPGRTLAIALPRHHGRPRQECRRDARSTRRSRHRRGHVRAVFDRQRPAPQHLARRRHDAVPQREEHQLGRRVPHSAGWCAGPGGSRPARSPTRSCSTTTGCRPSWQWPARRTSWTS